MVLPVTHRDPCRCGKLKMRHARRCVLCERKRRRVSAEARRRSAGFRVGTLRIADQSDEGRHT